VSLKSKAFRLLQPLLPKPYMLCTGQIFEDGLKEAPRIRTQSQSRVFDILHEIQTEEDDFLAQNRRDLKELYPPQKKLCPNFSFHKTRFSTLHTNRKNRHDLLDEKMNKTLLMANSAFHKARKDEAKGLFCECLSIALATLEYNHLVIEIRDKLKRLDSHEINHNFTGL